jgi:hypothetical protein
LLNYNRNHARVKGGLLKIGKYFCATALITGGVGAGIPSPATDRWKFTVQQQDLHFSQILCPEHRQMDGY